jgi:SPP1 family predicted phage head-tail adaptor
MRKPRRTPPGEMRDRLEIQLPNTEATGSGETVDNPPKFVANAWAKVTPLTGRETWLNREQTETVTDQVNMLYQPGITARMRAVCNGRTLNFTAVRDLEGRHEELEILAIEAIAE